MFDHTRVIEIFDRSGIDYLIHVPATGMSPVYDHYEKRSACINVLREEEGVAIAAGMAIAGKIPLLFIQQSGVGNMLNSYIGLAEGYGIYFPIVVLDRGITDENPIQAYSSQRTIPIIEALQPPCYIDFSAEGAPELFREEMINQRRWFISKY